MYFKLKNILVDYCITANIGGSANYGIGRYKTPSARPFRGSPIN